MKKLLFLALSFGLLISCSKDDNNGIPPVNPSDKSKDGNTEDVAALETNAIGIAEYNSYLNKKVKLHGQIARIDGFNAYFKLKDGKFVEIYTKNDNINEETKNKLQRVGQEVTVVGKFEDYAPKNGDKVHEIVYAEERDLTFGTLLPAQTPVELDVARATVSDYQDGKEVKLHGNIVREGNKSYFKLSDNTLIQIYTQKKVFDALSQEAKTKLETAGQELTVVGLFVTHNNIKEIVYRKESHLTFGTTPNVQPTPPATEVVELEAAHATVSDFQDGKAVKIHGNITVQGSKAYFKFSDDTLIQIFAHKNILKTLSKEQKDNLKVNGKEVTVKGKFGTYQGTKQITYESASDLTFN